ncbi:LysR family transcriptional regulator [Pseudomonas gingeri]|uniref:LysR family transcriptional regulator n=1 Tax=Pseudomonas gingeri TaxID=117681 RepID=A0A7Y7YFH0_9PSED|nr:LysR family transcriptional regulator [Pseudomonas gingeri]NWB27900.1 LysR family transcriptional regulator [Pseudomonas gingeri]NWC35423.1 LysR family transcriptional regulator [Pseudomonas gingeri]
MKDLDWNDLRYLLAMARGRSAAGAARALGVSHATVLRRLQALEQEVGTALFDRLQTGYIPTDAGQRLIEIGEALERALTGARREMEGQAKGLAGPVRFTTTDSLADCILPNILHTFHERFPAITVEMRITNARLDLDRREADVALRPTHEPPPAWVGKSLARMDWGVYAGPSCLKAGRHGPAVQTWLLPDGQLAEGPINPWLRERIGGATIAATADSFLALRRLAEIGTGATVLPCFMAHGTELELLEFPPRALSPGLWLLTHPHLRGSGRIKAFMDHLAQHIHVLRGRFETS